MVAIYYEFIKLAGSLIFAVDMAPVLRYLVALLAGGSIGCLFFLKRGGFSLSRVRRGDRMVFRSKAPIFENWTASKIQTGPSL